MPEPRSCYSCAKFDFNGPCEWRCHHTDGACWIAHDEEKDITMHTPGPWKLEERKDCLAIKTTNGNEIVFIHRTGSVTTQNRTGEEIKANGQLIAAAPELLEACTKLLNICQWKCGPNDEIILPCGTSNQTARVEAFKAIQKATRE
jgi:hypothetical protein